MDIEICQLRPSTTKLQKQWLHKSKEPVFVHASVSVIVHTVQRSRTVRGEDISLSNISPFLASGRACLTKSKLAMS